MSHKKLTHTKNYQDEAILDNILRFIKTYLPQKKKRSSLIEPLLVKHESFTIHKINNLTSDRSKSLRRNLSNVKLTFTVGNWALPYLNFLKRIKLLKERF